MTQTPQQGSNGRSRDGGAEDWKDFWHTGPGTLAGRYMRMFWQPVYRAEDVLPGRAKPFRVMSEDLTLYRGEDGAAHVVAFRCAHRGTQLSTGWVEGDNLRCFYHGWMYGPDGQCVEQPAEPEPFAQKVRIRSYPTEEYLGLIFVYLGEGDAPPLPRYPDFEVDGNFEIGLWTQPCNFFQVHENDPVHPAFVHRNAGLPKGVFGRIPRVSVEETEWGMAEYRRWDDGEFRDSHHGMPNVSHNMKWPKTEPPMPESGWVNSLYWRVPIDDEHMMQPTVDLTRVTGKAKETFRERRATWMALERQVPVADLAEKVLAGEMHVDELNDYRGKTKVVSAQDYVSQVGQGAIVDRSNEHLGRTDVGVILLRKMWTRELRALAEGRPLKQWKRPDDLVASTSQYGSNAFVEVPKDASKVAQA